MKKHSFVFAILAILISFIFSSCENDSFLETENPNDAPRNKPELRAEFSHDGEAINNKELQTNWESVTRIDLNGKLGYVQPPWVSPNDIPASYAKDIKKSDGWNMLSHTMLDVNSAQANYMIFYNKYRGVLKVFYYNPQAQNNQNLVWVIEADEPTSILPSNTLVHGNLNSRYQYATTSNSLHNSVANFGHLVKGWNMFTLELPYGIIYSDTPLSFRAYNTIKSETQLSGTFSGEITINIPQQSPSFLSSLVSIITSIPKFAAGGIGSIDNIKKGATFIGKLGSSSLFKSKSGDMIVKGTMSGGVQLTGSTVTNLGGAVESLTGIELKKMNNNANLGLWDINGQIGFEYNKYSIGTMKPDRYYDTQMDAVIPNIEKSICINPEAKPFIKSYSVSCDYFMLRKSAPYDFKSVAIVEKEIYELVKMTNISLWRTGFLGNSDVPSGTLLIIEHEITDDIYASVTVTFEFIDGSSYQSTRNYKLGIRSFDNWDDAYAKASRYPNFAHVKH